jgi:hypothetical protein
MIKIASRAVEHEDENVYLSSIVDEAVRRYYEFVFGNKSSGGT